MVYLHVVFLSTYGISEKENSWLKSYLSNRNQYVDLNGSSSNYEKVTCGVPQGSILGPLLFILYINDMHRALEKCITHHFADDTNLLYANKDPKVLQKYLE